MEFLETLSKLEPLAAFVGAHSWVWPGCEILHFFGMSLLVGTVALLDLRMLGVVKDLPLTAVHRLIPFALIGFAVNLATGLVFLFGDPFMEPGGHFQNITFVLKMCFILGAGLNAIAFYAVPGTHEMIAKLDAGADAPRRAKMTAATSLVLWIGVIYLGRMLPYTDAFYFVFHW